MKLRLLMIYVVIIGLSAIIVLMIYQPSQKINPIDNRESLKEVVYSNTICSIHYRTELWDMWDNKTHDYKNDPIFQECSLVLEFENYANTSYDPNPEQLKDILEHCIDSKNLVDTEGLSYSNNTHYIDNVNCEWQELEMLKNLDLLRN